MSISQGQGFVVSFEEEEEEKKEEEKKEELKAQ